MPTSPIAPLLASAGIRPWWPLVEPTARWIRVRLDGHLVADTRRALLLVDFGPDVLPTYYVPFADVAAGALADPRERDDGTVTWTVRAGDRAVTDAALASGRHRALFPGLEGHVTFRWDTVDWFEEDQRLFAHARDPHKRVDVLSSSRHVQVAVDGVVLADSHRPTLVFETTLPTRHYLPQEDVRMDLLVSSDLRTACPYKGHARYWSVDGGGRRLDDIAWSYADPVPEQPGLRGLVCFFDERVDVTVDGVLQPRPRTPWS